MGRIVDLKGSPSTQRHRLRRTVAEALRRMMAKPTFDQESRDLTALIVFALREIDENINRSADAWERRDYYVKADRFRHQWSWVIPMARLLESALRDRQWQEIAPLLVQLLPYFQDIKVSKLTRSSRLWAGAYERLLEES